MEHPKLSHDAADDPTLSFAFKCSAYALMNSSAGTSRTLRGGGPAAMVEPMHQKLKENQHTSHNQGACPKLKSPPCHRNAPQGGLARAQ